MVGRTRPPDEKLLLDAIRFSKRMGNYLYFPIFLVCGFCALVMLGLERQDGPWKSTQEERLFALFAIGAIIGFVLWRASRKLHPKLLLFEGVLLGGLTTIWVGWIALNLIFRFPHFWQMSRLRLSYPIVVAVGMGGAAIKCLRLWNTLRKVDAYELESTLERLSAGLHEDRPTSELDP